MSTVCLAGRVEWKHGRIEDHSSLLQNACILELEIGIVVMTTLLEYKPSIVLYFFPFESTGSKEIIPSSTRRWMTKLAISLRDFGTKKPEERGMSCQ